jgi:hypothetical protein
MDTFVVRLWRPVEAGAGAAPAAHAAGSELHGTAQHVASGRAAPFRSGTQLLDVLAELLAAPRTESPDGDAAARGDAAVL